MKCLSLRLCKSYRFKEDNEPGSFEKFKSIDDLNIISDSTATRNANQNQRRYAVIWEPVQNSTKAIPVFVKSSKDKDQIKYAFERDEFLNKVIVGKRLQKVIDAMYIREVKMKEKIILEGDPGKHMYIISEGKFEVSKEAKGVVATLQAGRVFGELAILYKSRRQATVKALTPGKVWVLDREVYQTIVKQYNIEEKSERVVFLEECPILNKVDRDVLEKVADLLHVEYFPTGKVIVREGAPADKFYIITAGSVTIMKESEGFKGYLYKGNCFGERAILSEGVRQATVLAGNSGVECLTLDRQHFINHFGNVEDIAKISIPKLPKVVLKPQEVDKNQNLKSADFRILCTIGEGGFGRVEMIQKKNDPSITFALKCLNRIDMVKNKQSQHILNEKEIQMACESPS
ncbi:hypothetical protein HHI36_006643 [Cryptolaemus montrouzieri]|uniref:cGMP-dependent protein kinase n=1 Tax=Cryptolaemus montrouzieri TaxID=559131 RepID=A0ABD2NXQ3_9CUCU